MPRRLRSVALTVVGSLWLTGGACPTTTARPAYTLSVPSEMSVATVATGWLRAPADDPTAPPMVVTPILIQEGCSLTVVTPAASRDVEFRMGATRPGPCSFALEVTAGELRWRVDPSIRFLDVPTLVETDEPTWWGPCFRASFAEQVEGAVLCGFEHETVVHTGPETVRLSGHLRATDRRGGWVICGEEGCQVRGTDGTWRTIDALPHGAGRITALENPAGKFLADGSEIAPLLIARDTGAVTALPRLPDGAPTSTTVAAGYLLAPPDPTVDPPGAWHLFTAGNWLALTPAPALFTHFTEGPMPETTVTLSGGGLAQLDVDVAEARLVATPVRFDARDLEEPVARGAPGSGLALLRPIREQWTVLHLVRAGPRGFELLAVAPASVIEPADLTWIPIVTEDGVSFASPSSTRSLRLVVSR